MEKLKPCPFCGRAPRLFLDGDDTYAIECDRHGWTERDGDGVRIAGDIGVYAEAEMELDDNLEWVVSERSLAAARRKVVELWNAGDGEPEGRTCHDDYDGREFRCSACGAMSHVLERDEAGDWQFVGAPRFCPHCGAEVVADA